MHHGTKKIFAQLQMTGRLTITLAEGDTSWNPTQMSGLDIRGPARVTYTLHPDGRVQLSVSDISPDPEIIKM